MTDHERLIRAIERSAHCWFSTHELWYSAYEMLVDMGWQPSTQGERALQLGVSHGDANVTVKNRRDFLLACTYSLDFLKSVLDGDHIEEFYDESFLHPVCIEVDTKGLLEAVFDEVPT